MKRSKAHITPWFIQRGYSVKGGGYPADYDYYHNGRSTVKPDGYEARLPPSGKYKELLVEDSVGKLVLLVDVRITRDFGYADITFDPTKLRVLTPLEVAVRNLLK